MGYGSSTSENTAQKSENDVEEKRSGNENETKRKVEMNSGENVVSTAVPDSKTNDDVKVSLKRHFSDTLDSDSTVGGSSRDGDGEQDSDEREKRQKLDDEITKGLSMKRLKSSDYESCAKDVTEKEEENDELKTDLKVPPLKIVLPSQNIVDSDAANGNRSTRNGNSKNPSNLPYVISAVASDSMSESEEMPTSTTSSAMVSGSAVAATTANALDKTDDKKDKEKEMSSEDQRIANQRVLRSSHKLAQSNTSMTSDGTDATGSDSSYSSVTSTTSTATSAPGSSLPISTQSTTAVATATLTTTIASVSSPSTSSSSSSSSSSLSSMATTTTTMTTSAVASTSTATSSFLNTFASSSVSTSSTTTPATSHADTIAGETATVTTAVTSSETESDHSIYNEQESSSSSSVHLIPTAPMTMSAVEMHPRKRKLKQTKEQSASAQSSSATQQFQDNSSSSSEQFTNYSFHPHEQPTSNCYQLFMDIRKQIEKKRKNLFPVLPKPPQSFNDYLMNRCNYILHGSPNAEMPHLDAPDFVPVAMRDFYIEQEKERHKLRMQHLSEKEKLVLSVEQEILRVHGRAARALANQSLPYSVCTILRDEEVYNFITPEQEEKDRNARSRYNGRLFLSWLQDVDDKWEKIKELMLIRHRMEAEALHGVQKMDWEWKINDDFHLTVQLRMEDSHIPKVVVNDNFDLLPT